MAQIKNNNVTFGINVGTPKIPLPSFNTANTTPMGATSSPQSGFSSNPGPKIPVPSIYPQRNVKTDTSNQNTPGLLPPPNNQQPVPVGATVQGLQSQLDALRASQSNSMQQPAPQAPSNSRTGILNSTLNVSGNTAEQDRIRQQMEQTALQNKAIADNAQQISNKYGDEISRVGGLGAGAVAGDLSTGTNVVGSGNAAIASQSASSRMTALGTAQDAALKGTAQQLTAQKQTSEGLNSSLTGALSQQQNAITGYTNALNQSQPVQVPYGSQFIDPITGQSAGGAGMGGYSGYNAAQQAIALSGQYPDAKAQYDSNQTPEQNLQRIQQAIQSSPTYQKNTYGVPGQNTVAGGTAIQTAQKGFSDSYQTYQDIQKSLSYADDRANALSQVMTQYGIGQNDARKINEITNALGKQFGSAGQSSFETALTEAQRAYSSLLTMGGGTVPTEATAASNTILNPNATIGQINAAITQLKAAAQTRLQTQGTQANTYWSQLKQAGNSSQGSSSQGGGNSFAEQW